MVTTKKSHPRLGRMLTSCIFAASGLTSVFIGTPEAFASNAQVWCSTNSSSVGTLSWSFTDTPITGQSVKVKDLTISESSGMATKQYSFSVNGANPSSFSASTNGGSTNFGDYTFNITGSSGSAFSVNVTSIQTTVLGVSTGCPGAMGSVSGSPTFISQNISAPSSATTTAATSSGSNQQSANNSSSQSVSNGATASTHGAAVASSNRSSGTNTSASPTQGDSSQAKSASATKSTVKNKKSPKQSDERWYRFLLSPWFWFSIFLVLIPEYIRWQINRREKRLQAEIDQLEAEEEEIRVRQELSVPESLAAEPAANEFLGVLGELKDLSQAEISNN
jgi:hypothetical protein